MYEYIKNTFDFDFWPHERMLLLWIFCVVVTDVLITFYVPVNRNMQYNNCLPSDLSTGRTISNKLELDTGSRRVFTVGELEENKKKHH